MPAAGVGCSELCFITPAALLGLQDELIELRARLQRCTRAGRHGLTPPQPHDHDQQQAAQRPAASQQSGDAPAQSQQGQAAGTAAAQPGSEQGSSEDLEGVEAALVERRGAAAAEMAEVLAAQRDEVGRVVERAMAAMQAEPQPE